MLETLLHIGKILRAAKRMRHHRYIKPAPLSDPKSPVVYLSLPVRDDFEFDFDNIREITDENIQRNKLFYLTFKSSETDNAVKYIFGDILYGVTDKGKVLGYYKMKSGKSGFYSQSSFTRGQEDIKAFTGTIIEKFSKSFEKHLDTIESLLQEHGQGEQVFLHFDFDGKQWYEFEPELQTINQVLLSYFMDEQNGFCILRNFLYKTLIAGDSHTPDFSNNNAFKTKLFKSQDEIMDLIYAIDYSKTALISERDIKIVILPKGDELTAEHIENFFERPSGLEKNEVAEEKLSEANKPMQTDSLFDSLFTPVLVNVAGNITQFDFVFSQRGERGLDTDMVELSGIERSFLAELSERVNEIRESLRAERDALFPKRPKQFAFLDIRISFLNILGDVRKEQKKYQSHLFKILPQVYSGTYYRDDVLLPAFIEKVEFNTRDPERKISAVLLFNLLKYDFHFLVRLRNATGENFMDDMKNSKSYQAGRLLGKMAQPLGTGKNPKINSFEKNYVGLLSRRISDKQGLLKFANFINEKLAIHDVAYPNLKQASVELAGLVADMSDREYRKNYCAFGFFEGYFGRHSDAAKTDTQANDNNQ